MQEVRNSRRSFLFAGASVVTGAILAGCDGGSDKEIVVTKQENPSDKAKESMDYYMKNQMKKGAAKK